MQARRETSDNLRKHHPHAPRAPKKGGGIAKPLITNGKKRKGKCDVCQDWPSTELTNRRRVSFATQNSERTYNKAGRPSDAGLPQRKKTTSTPATKKRRHSVGSVLPRKVHLQFQLKLFSHFQDSPSKSALSDGTNVPTDDDLFEQFGEPAPIQSILKNPLAIRSENPNKRRRESVIFGSQSPTKDDEETMDYTGVFNQMMIGEKSQATDTQDYTQQMHILQKQWGLVRKPQFNQLIFAAR